MFEPRTGKPGLGFHLSECMKDQFSCPMSIQYPFQQWGGTPLAEKPDLGPARDKSTLANL
jgi:hypothetical protein